jgi:hypothetical protein
MELIIISIAAFLTSIITLFSGFGLGTLLTPVFVLFFPVEIAIALTGVVHFANNLFKLAVLEKHAQWRVILKFGALSIIGAFIGAEVLLSLTSITPITSYELFGKTHSIEIVKIIIAAMMIYFALLEMFPKMLPFTVNEKTLPLGGLLSGFFGGLSGNQGALRSAFLIRYNLSKEQFLATGVVIACFVDLIRLSLYSSRFLTSDAMQHTTIVAAAILSAFIGVVVGNQLLKKITLQTVQRIVAIMLGIIALGLGSGLI